ncbi:MAG TPA: hypothetical protein VF664_03565, partial [Cystobacter sp.]
HASIEGTHIPFEVLKQYARRTDAELAYDTWHMSLVLEWRVEYAGFELEREIEVLRAWGPEWTDGARRALAEAMASGEAEHPAVRRNQPEIDEVREVWRRSGGRTVNLGEPELTALYEARLEGITTMDEFHARPLTLDLDALVPPEVREVWRRSGGRTAKLGVPELTALYEAQLQGVTTMDEFQARPLTLDLDALLPPGVREEFLSLPDVVEVREEEVELDYEVEQDETGAPVGVVRLHLPEKLARTLVEEELPLFDRPVRFIVGRGRRGAVRADSLLDLQEQLDMPWMPDEIEAARDTGGGGRTGRGRGARRPRR